ncbi:MAG: cytochrome b N-terminal domain-containing protein [Deltaproteobacteria bacterium]|nr:cytochrome b N-terminal domain-containing protein [Deltaproteobacteria bacterium]
MTSWVRERLGAAGAPAMLEGGPSFAYVFGSVLVFLLVFEGLTGIALGMFYSPSTTDAWGSVAYLQDQTTWGWLVRGLHHHGGGAIVVVAGLHLVQTAVAGAYKKPRELVWWLGVLLLVLVVVWAVTGYVLRWDQEGYWANRVELGIAAGGPFGAQIQQVALGGNDHGNLSLTRFYGLHALLFPVLVGALGYLHVKVARRHGTTPVRANRTAPRFPDQAVRDAIACAVALAMLMGVVVAREGVELAAPADPSQSYDARPLWYFRWLFELRELAGSAEKLVALAAPAIVGGFLVALPLLDRGPSRRVRARLPWLGGLAGLLALIGALTMMSFARDANDGALAKRQERARAVAARARELAKTHGVPSSGGQDVWLAAPGARGRKVFADNCRGCHEDVERRAPLITAGHGDRAWMRDFLSDPSGDKFWGRTQLVLSQPLAEAWKDSWLEFLAPELSPMPAMNELDPADMDAVVELMYAQTGATDVDAAKRTAGVKVFGAVCSDCHELAFEVVGQGGPNLVGLGSRAYYFDFVGNPKHPLYMGPDRSFMPRFDAELSIEDRAAVADYLVWLRTATPQDLAALDGP